MAQGSQEYAENGTWKAYRAGLYGFVLKRVGDTALAEDIVQDVLMRAYAARGSLKSPRSLRAWLYQITRNAIVDYYRSRRLSEPIQRDFTSEERERDKRGSLELARCMRPFLNELPLPYRRAITLAEIDGLTQREVATRLGLSLSGAKSRVQRARKMLAARLLDCCRVELDRRGGIVDYQQRKRCDPC